MAELRQNRVKHKLQRGEVVTSLSGPHSADVIDFLGQFDFDAIWIEGEHGPNDFGDIPDLTRACDLWGKTSIVRVNVNAPGVIYRTFDVGAQGLVIPHVNTEEEARAVVDAAKFSPIGSRGMFTSRQGYGVPNYVNRANDETILVVLIEDIGAVNNLDDILKVDEIDVFFVAPGDLAQTMGHLGQFKHPEVLDAVDRSIEKIIGAGRVAGALVDDGTVEAYVKKGVRFVQTGWQAWVAAGATAYLKKVASAS